MRKSCTFICDRYFASSSCCLSVAVSVNFSAVCAARKTISWGDLMLVLCSTFLRIFAIVTRFQAEGVFMAVRDANKPAYDPNHLALNGVEQ